MYKTQRKLVIVSVNILAVLLFACLVVFLIPIKSQKYFSVYTLLVVFVVFLAVLFLCNKLKSVLLKYVRKRNLEAGETLLLRNFIDKLRFCYTLDDFYGAITDFLEKQGDCAVLLVDRITECVAGKYAKGYKNMTMNEEFFQGHFPGNPIMPGVLQLEALAQCSAPIVMCMPEYQGKLTLYAGVDNVRFKNIVRPGDKFEMHVE